MSKKYVIEIKPEYEDKFKGVMILGAENGNLYVDSSSVEELEELNSDYINEHFGDLQDTAYQKGINDGSLDVKQRVEGAYQRGLNDAWEAAKKILQMYDFTVFGLEHDGVFESPLNEGQQMTPQEAIEKLKAYEEKQKDEIEVGDEVVSKHSGTKGILLEPETEDVLATIIVPSQRWRTIHNAHENLEKTGKHYDIEKLLEAMKA